MGGEREREEVGVVRRLSREKKKSRRRSLIPHPSVSLSLSLTTRPHLREAVRQEDRHELLFGFDVVASAASSSAVSSSASSFLRRHRFFFFGGGVLFRVSWSSLQPLSAGEQTRRLLL